MYIYIVGSKGKQTEMGQGGAAETIRRGGGEDQRTREEQGRARDEENRSGEKETRGGEARGGVDATEEDVAK